MPFARNAPRPRFYLPSHRRVGEPDDQTRRCANEEREPLPRYGRAAINFGMPTIKQADFIQSIADALQHISYYHPADYISA